MYWRRNPDEEIRRIERAAQAGDSHAQDQLLVWRARAGDRSAMVQVALHELGEALTAWASRDGRSILRGDHAIFLPGEWPFKKRFGGWSFVTVFPVDEEETLNQIRLSWEATVAIESVVLENLQKEICDIRLLRPYNDVRVTADLMLDISAIPHSDLEGDTTVGGAIIDYVSCDWYPELIRPLSASSYHSGWSDYRGIIPACHPYTQLRAIVEQHLETVFISGSVWRQDGPTGSL